MSREKPSSIYLRAYVDVERVMMAFDDSDEVLADALRDALDPIWKALSDDDRVFLNQRKIVAPATTDDDDIRLLPEVTKLSLDDLRAYVRQRARHIARQTPGEPDASWDDPEEWQSDAAELAHGVVRLLNDGR